MTKLKKNQKLILIVIWLFLKNLYLIAI